MTKADTAGSGDYRKEAQKLRRRAEDATDEAVRRNLLKIAEQYEQLADAIDRARR